MSYTHLLNLHLHLQSWCQDLGEGLLIEEGGWKVRKMLIENAPTVQQMTASHPKKKKKSKIFESLHRNLNLSHIRNGGYWIAMLSSIEL